MVLLFVHNLYSYYHIVLLLFLRIDYRFKNNIECCSDEYDYFIHASTIVEDFDLDYSNQELRDFKYTYGSKSAPVGFVGTGILTAPFLFIGKILNRIFNENINEYIFNFQIFTYSMSSVIYFLFSYIYLFKTMKLMGGSINKYNLIELLKPFDHRWILIPDFPLKN